VAGALLDRLLACDIQSSDDYAIGVRLGEGCQGSRLRRGAAGGENPIALRNVLPRQLEPKAP
jgi:hypothetical protein